MVIAYVGFERCDIPYYIAKAAIALNQKTLVIDNSVTGDLFRSLTDATDRFREFDMFTIIRGLNVTEDDIEGFENTIIYHGLSRYNEQYQIKPDCVYVSTTMAKHVILDTACALENAGLKDAKKAILVVEDEVQRKYSLQEIANEIDIIPVNGYVIPLNEVDHNKYEMLCANGAVSLKNCSQDMKEVIFEAIVELSGVANPKQVNKFISRL